MRKNRFPYLSFISKSRLLSKLKRVVAAIPRVDGMYQRTMACCKPLGKF